MGRPERWLLALVLLTSRPAGAAPPTAEPFPSCYPTLPPESPLSSSEGAPSPAPSVASARPAAPPSSSSPWPAVAFAVGSLSLLLGLSWLWQARSRRAAQAASKHADL
jgi:hypothetical protein